MFNFYFDYVVINLFLLWLMCYAGRMVSREKRYWKYASLCVIAFVFIEGMRYGRGVDYMHYIDVYNYDLEDKQWLFTALNRMLKAMGVIAVFSFMVYAIPFIIGGMRLMKEMREFASYTYPLFLICFISFHESFIRQALATSFVFIYIVKLNDILREFSLHKIQQKKIAVLLLWAIASYSIHSITLIALIIITIIFVFIHRPFPYFVTIPLLLFGKYYLANSFDWNSINNLLNFIGSQDEKLSGYTDNMERWFSEDAMSEAYTRNVYVQILETVADITLLYLGAKICKYVSSNVKQDNADKSQMKLYDNTHIYVSLYNVFVVGVLIFQTFYNLEIVRRVAYSWYLFWFVPLAMVLYYRKKKYIFKPIERWMMLAFLFWAWDYIRFLFIGFDKKPLFIWDNIVGL